MREELINQIQRYVPFNEQEEKDKDVILKALIDQPDIFLRDNKIAHMTASCWIVNHERTKVIMAYHNIYDSWSWLGGHADGIEDLLQVAVREAKEESGIKTVKPVSDEIYSLECLTVDGHIKRGGYVTSHIHLNITYLLEADEKEELFLKEDENSDVQWFSLEDAVDSSTEPWFKEHIYSKLNQKLNNF